MITTYYFITVHIFWVGHINITKSPNFFLNWIDNVLIPFKFWNIVIFLWPSQNVWTLTYLLIEIMCKFILFISNYRSSLSLQHCSLSRDRWDDQSHIFASDNSWPEVAFANSFFDRKRGRKWRGALATMVGCMRYREWACCSTAKDHKTASDCRSNDWRVAEPLQKISVSFCFCKVKTLWEGHKIWKQSPNCNCWMGTDLLHIWPSHF